MTSFDPVPFGDRAQRVVTRQWELAADGRVDRARARGDVLDSWQRSVQARVPADLRRAPLALDAEMLQRARQQADWVPFALRAAARLGDSFADGHVLSLFDANGHMLACDGDPAALDGLADINFRPGGLWAEHAVGTNGPGTALALGRPVHIVGAEHFCETWHDWHCAAVPLCDPVTGDLLGVIDISGFRRHAHPHTLELAIALASSVGQLLAVRDSERRCAVLHQFADLASRHGQDALVAVDRHGRVLHATPSAPAGLRPGTVTPDALRAAIVSHVRPAQAPGEVFLSIGEDIGVTALSFPVMDADTAVGACLLLRGGATMRSAPARNIAGGDMAPRATAPRAAPARTRYGVDDIVGTSPCLRAAVDIATAAAGNTLPVFITGESGTGKEVFAQAIHDASARRQRPFVAVNCAALPRELVEAELFGYVGGAFTGARREGTAGRFREAEGGTIFLDEISEMPLGAQASLLRVLQEQEVTALGGTGARRIDVRVIAATNRPVQAALDSGALRHDLYYRLDVLGLALPTLRERPEDVPALAHHFLEQAAIEVGRPNLMFAPAVLDVLARHAWPGNVRELRNLVRRLASLSVGTVINIGQLPPALLAGAPIVATPAVAASPDARPRVSGRARCVRCPTRTA